MGDYIDIFEYNLKLRNGISENEVRKILESLEVFTIVHAGDSLFFEEDSDIYYEPAILEDFNKIAKIADGFIVLLWDDRTLSGYKFENGRVVRAEVKLELLEIPEYSEECEAA